MENKKGLALRIVLYLIPLLSFFVGTYFFVVRSLLGFMITSAISLGIYIFLILKNYKVISPLSSATFVIMTFVILAMSISGEGGFQANPFNEKAYMFGVALVLFFNLFVGVVWYKKDKTWKKILAVIYLVITNILLISFSSVPVAFYSNFIYTRIFIALYFLFSIFMIIKGKVVFRIFGIIGIFLSIGCLVLSAMILASKVYTLENEERREVFDFVDPKAKEMIKYYNNDKLTQDTFCKYCGMTLTSTLYSNPKTLSSVKESYGDIITMEEPIIYRAVGRFYIEYPAKFKNSKNTQYVIFVVESIDLNSTIFGFAISPQLGIL